MAKTLSTMLELGTSAPDFSLPDVVSGKTVSLNDFADKKALLVMFICRHCPFVKHLERELARIGNDYASKDVGIVAISANNAAEFPDDARESLKEMAAQLGFKFPCPARHFFVTVNSHSCRSTGFRGSNICH